MVEKYNDKIRNDKHEQIWNICVCVGKEWDKTSYAPWLYNICSNNLISGGEVSNFSLVILFIVVKIGMSISYASFFPFSLTFFIENVSSVKDQSDVIIFVTTSIRYETGSITDTLITWPIASKRTLSFGTPQCVGILLTFFII